MNEERIPCPKCGQPMQKSARYCIHCGTINAAYETNKKVVSAINKSIADYNTGKMPLIKEKNKGAAIANNTGNRKLAFILTYLLYLLMIIMTGIATYLTGVNTFDILIMSSYPMTIILISVMFLYIYSIELIFMKCNKPWWAGLVPIYNLIVLGDITFHKKYIGLLSFVPIIGQIFLLVMLYKLGEKFKYSGLLTMLFSILFIPIIGYSDHLYEGNAYVTSGDSKSLEKDYRNKKIFFSTIVVLLLCGIVLFLMGNMGKVRKAGNAFNGTYYVFASKQALKQVKKAVEEDRIQCDQVMYSKNAGVYYINYPDLGEKVSLPLYMMRDPIAAYVKINNDTTPTEYSISLTDGKYGFKETVETEITTRDVIEYTQLEVLPAKYVCKIGSST